MSDIKSEMNAELEGNPFAGIAEAMVGTIQLQWGWAVMVIGIVLLVSSCLMPNPKLMEFDL